MNAADWIALMGVIVPLINTSLICWLIWFTLKTTQHNEEIIAHLRRQQRHDRDEAAENEGSADGNL